MIKFRDTGCSHTIEGILLGIEIIRPEEEALIKFLNSRGKYFSISDPDGLRRLSRRFSLSEKDVQEALHASGFDLVLRIPIKAYWIRKEVLPEIPENNGAEME
jgi:hypothetical protein